MNLSFQGEFEYLISSQRKSPRVVAKTLGKAAIDLGELLKEQKRPYHLGEALYEGCRSISEYAYDEGIRDVVLIDKSARPLWAGIAQYWDLAYPESRRPRFSFINPSLFRSIIKNSQNAEELSWNIAQIGEIYAENLQASKSQIASRMEDPLLLVDTCLHSGRSAYLTKRVLQEAGFGDIRFGVVRTTLPSGGMIAPDVHGTDNILAAHCVRSDISSTLVVDNEHSIYSSARHQPLANAIGRDIRHEIGALIAERYRIDNE